MSEAYSYWEKNKSHARRKQEPFTGGTFSALFDVQTGNEVRYVAKIPSSEEGLAQARNEIRILNELSHKQNIIPLVDVQEELVDVGLDQSMKLPTLILPKASHGSLIGTNDKIKVFPVMETVDYIIQAASGLGNAHKKGIAQNDFHPGNILRDHTLRRDEKLTIWLADFGLAGHYLEERLVPGGHVSAMAPEKTGSNGVVNDKTDLYALGVAAYELITGELPFGRPSRQAIEQIRREMGITDEGTAMIEAWEKRHREEAVPEFSQRWDLSRFPDRMMSRDREKVQGPVMKLLAKKPEDRYDTAEDFIEDLRRFSSKENKNPTIIEAGKVVYDDPLSRKARKQSEDPLGRAIERIAAQRTSRSSSSTEGTPRQSTLKAPDFLDQTGKNKKEAVRKPSQKKKTESSIDRRTLLKAGAGVVAAGAVWYLVESLNNGLSESESSPQDKLMKLAKEGITYFQEQGDIGSAGEIAAFIGEDEVAREGIAYWEENHFYGAAGEIAARIGDIKAARQMISACEKNGQQYQVGRIAALLDDKSLARKKVSSLQKEGQHGLASYIAAFIGDDSVAAQGVKGETSALAGEVFAMLSQSKETTEIMNSLDDQGFYHTAGRLAAIIGDEKSVNREIQNIQTSDDLTEKVVQQREGEAAYVAAEALWWRKWRGHS